MFLLDFRENENERGSVNDLELKAPGHHVAARWFYYRFLCFLCFNSGAQLDIIRAIAIFAAILRSHVVL